MVTPSKNIFAVTSTLSGLRQFLATTSPLKMVKSVFHFILKAPFVLKIFKFCLDFLVMRLTIH